MNTEFIIENLRFEILRPFHDLSRFRSKSRKLNRFLKREALECQKLSDRVTHLVICDEKVIAYFSLLVHFEGIPHDDYEEIRKTLTELPEPESIPLVEITHFAIDRRYEDCELAGAIFDNIIYNIKNIFRQHSAYQGVSICVGENCLFPVDDSVDLEELEREVMKVIEKKEKEGEYFFIGEE